MAPRRAARAHLRGRRLALLRESAELPPQTHLAHGACAVGVDYAQSTSGCVRSGRQVAMQAKKRRDMRRPVKNV